MRKIKMIKCPVCNRVFKRPEAWCTHMERSHPDEIPEGFTIHRYLYALVTGKYKGSCMYCHAETSWNEEAGKYVRICGSKACKEKYAEQHQLLSPDKQREMLANRGISKIYKYGPDKVPKIYTGTYELKFMMLLEKLGWPAEDFDCPSPHTYYYDYVNPEDKEHEGKHFYIPDWYFHSLNCEVEIKDHSTTHPKFNKIDRVKEECKDKRMYQLRHQVNYVKVVDNNFAPFFKFLKDNKYTFSDAEMSYQLLFPSQESFILDSAPIVPYDSTIGYNTLKRFWGEKKAKEIAENRDKIEDLRKRYENCIYPCENNYVEEKLQTDVIRAWIRDTGILVIHACETEEELNQLYYDWLKLPPERRQISERKSWEIFGVGNIQHYNLLKMKYRKIRNEIQPIATEAAIKRYVANKVSDVFEMQESLYDMLHDNEVDVLAKFQNEDGFIQYQEKCLNRFFEYIHSFKLYIKGSNTQGKEVEVSHTITFVQDHVIGYYIYPEAVLDDYYSGVFISMNYVNFFYQVLEYLIKKYEIVDIDECRYVSCLTGESNVIEPRSDIDIHKLQYADEIFIITNVNAKEESDDPYGRDQ